MGDGGGKDDGTITEGEKSFKGIVSNEVFDKGSWVVALNSPKDEKLGVKWGCSMVVLIVP